MRKRRTLMLLLVPLVCGATPTGPTPSGPDAGAPLTASPADAGTSKATPPSAALATLSKASDTSRFLALPQDALEPLARKIQDAKRTRPIVVVQYGDSHTQAGFLSRELRNSLAQGGLASPGFVAPGWHHLGDAHSTLAGQWRTENWLKPSDIGSFGPLGCAFVTRDPRARALLTLKAPPPSGVKLTALYLRNRRSAPFRIVANGTVLNDGTPASVPANDDRMLGAVEVDLPPGTAEVALEMNTPRWQGPELRFFGFLVQYPNAVVEWDALGVQGTAVDHPLNRGDRTIEEYLQFRQPDAIVVWYGSNSLVAPNYDPVTYGKTFDAFLSRLRAAAPQAARLVVGPPDLARRPSSCPTWASPTVRVKRRVGRHYVFRTVKRKMSPSEQLRWATFVCKPETLTFPVAHHGATHFPVTGIRSAAQWLDYLQSCQIRTLPAVATITDAERSAALREGYAFFDTYAFMDGPGSIHRWVCQQPQLARFDHVHLTPEGYDTVADGIWASLQDALHVKAAPAAVPAAPAPATPAPQPADDDDDNPTAQGG